jgi:hypothetical protein
MKRFQRKTNPGVIDGTVQKKNRTDESPTLYSPARSSLAVHRLKPGFGYRHVLRQKDVTDFLRLLPGWERLSEGLNAILLASGNVRCDGWYRPGVVAVCAWERGLWREMTRQSYTDHQDLFERLEVPCEATEDGYVLCQFTEPSVRAYQLLHILLHELGHHHDRMTTRSQVDTCRGEGYAEGYAWEHEQQVWDRYVAAFGLY